MAKLKLKYTFLLYILTWVINILLILIVFASITGENLNIYFSSDTLYLASIYKDIFIDETGFKGWNLNAAPNFFPDMFLYFIINKIISDFRTAYIVFSIIQYFLILILLNILLKSVKPDINKIYFSVLNLIFPVFLLTAIISGFDIYTYFIFSHSFHTGVFINALFGLIFFFKYLQKPRNLFLYLSAIISLIAVYNDRLFLVLFVFPLIIVFILNYFRFKNKQIKIIIPIIIITSLISLLINWFTASNSIFTCISLGQKYMNFENIIPSLNYFINQHYRYIVEFRIKGIISIITIINFFALLLLIVSNNKKPANKEGTNFIDKIFFSYMFVAIFLTLFTPVINGYYFGEATTRFNIFSFWFSVFNLTIFIQYIFKNNIKYVYIITTFLFTFYIGLIIIKFSSISVFKNIESFSNYYPEKVKVIDEFTKKNKLKYGLAEYWNAKYTTMFSKNELRVYTIIDEKLNLWFHVMNRNWYFDYNKGKYNKPVFNFIILENFDKNKIKENFGEPIDSLVYKNETILYLINNIKFRRDDNKAYLLD
ncbi:MAG: hypothetical protein JXA16_02895 [Bacteroidales bacterium]|nr:hypothetical protein [Bacteroidales bacterium]